MAILDVRGRMVIEALDDQPLPQAVRALVRRGTTRILVNLEHVPVVDTTGLCDVVEAYVAAQRQGAELKLLRPTPHVRHVLDVTRLSTVLDICESEADALARYAVEGAR